MWTAPATLERHLENSLAVQHGAYCFGSKTLLRMMNWDLSMRATSTSFHTSQNCGFASGGMLDADSDMLMVWDGEWETSARLTLGFVGDGSDCEPERVGLSEMDSDGVGQERDADAVCASDTL